MKHDHSKWLRHCEQTFAETSASGGLSHLAFSKKLALESGVGSPTPITVLTGDLSRSSISLNAGHQSSDDESSTSSETVAKDCTNPPDAACVVKRATVKPKPEKIIMPAPACFPGHENGSKPVSRELLSLDPRDEEEESEKGLLHSSSDPGLSLEEFIQYMNSKGRKGLYEEYNMIKSKPLEGAFEFARLRENQLKNRYTDVLCYDHSRVCLPLERQDSDETDYINAN